jgi:osmoprotectant transport system substrate-binding protein
VKANKFVVLQDPKKLFGFANVQPMVSKAGLSTEGVAALNAVSAKLDTQALLTMGDQVQNQKKDPLDVAKAWLASVGLG